MSLPLVIQRHRRELSVALAYVALLAVLAAVAPGFFAKDSLRSVLVRNAPTLIVAVGMTLVILGREIDISVGSQYSIVAVLAGLLAKAGWPFPMVALGCLAAGSAMGAVNGALVAALGLPSIVVTLATLAIGREGLRYLREGAFVSDLPSSFQWLGLGQGLGQWVVVGLALLVFAVVAWGLRNLSGGRALYATGSDPEAARLAGIRPRRVVFTSFVALGALTSLAALLDTARFASADPNAGNGLELPVIAAVVVGGVSISGGRGTVFGTLIGVALLGTIGPALVFLGAPAQWEKAVQGLIILLAVASDALPRKGG